MTPYILQRIPHADVVLFEHIRKAIQALPDLDFGVDESGKEIVLSCHMLARATSKVFNIQYVDGFFEKSWQHSWLVTPERNIIDVYPIAIYGGPFLVHAASFGPTRYLYETKDAKAVSRGRFGLNSFRRSVRRLTKEIVKHA